MESLKKTVLVTGSTGFVARHVIDRLLETTKYTVVSTYRKNIGDYQPNKRLFFEKADLLSLRSFNEIFVNYRPDYFIHLAAMARVKDGISEPIASVKSNLIASIELIKMCNEYNVSSAVFASSNLAQNSASIVGYSKLLLEQYVQKSIKNNTRLICYRVPNVIDSSGAVTNIFRKQITENKPVTITHPEMSRMFTSGNDAAKEIVYLLEKGNHKGVYVTYKEPLKIIDLAKQMIAESGKKLEIKTIGIKPGEKLSEHSFHKDDVYETDIPFLGQLKEYNFNSDLTVSTISKLIESGRIKSDTEIIDFLKKTF